MAPEQTKNFTLRPGDEWRLTNVTDSHFSLRARMTEEGLILETFSEKWVQVADSLQRRLENPIAVNVEMDEDAKDVVTKPIKTDMSMKLHTFVQNIARWLK